jgi:hypothetical protein
MSTPAKQMVADHNAAIPATDTGVLLAAIANAARDPAVDVEKMRQLFALRKQITDEANEATFNIAMSQAQQEMGRISTDAVNSQTRSKYATYGKLDKALRPIYTKHGFAISFNEGETAKPDYVRVLAYVTHTGGFSRTYHRDMPADGKGAKGGDVMTLTHAAGAAQSYGMRYLLKAIFNVAVGEDDTDGNDATPRISETQIADLEALMSEVNAKRDAFMRYYKIDKLADIPASSYDTVVKSLVAKRKKS